MRVKGKHVILAFVFMTIGFMFSFSYQFTAKVSQKEVNNVQIEKENKYRKQLNEQEQTNRLYEKELLQKTNEVRELEKQISLKDKTLYNLYEENEKYRKIVGSVPIVGPGVEVTLTDASFIPSEENVNNYIVHESHVQKVVNELKVSGAEAIAINGQRLTAQSYIVCIGPVIEVDGNKYPAPFVISAIGDPIKLAGSLNLPSGVKDQLVNDNIEVKIAKMDEILLGPITR